jgi:hypothetical protein
MEYRNFFIQDPAVGIGRGRDNYNALAGYRDYRLGILNDKGNRTFNNTIDGRNSTDGSDDGAAMQWRGLEHYYAGTFRWCHGINVNAGDNGRVYLALNPDRFADDTTANYANTNSLINTADAQGYIGGFTDDAGLFFFPETGGTASTYVTDYFVATYGTTGWRVPLFGGASDNGAACGPWQAQFGLIAANSDVNIGPLISR